MDLADRKMTHEVWFRKGPKVYSLSLIWKGPLVSEDELLDENELFSIKLDAVKLIDSDQEWIIAKEEV